MIVMKFGGTSLADPERVRNVVEIVRERLSRRPVLVVSAHAGVTNQLDAMALAALEESAGIEPIRELHERMIRELGLAPDLVEDLLEELDSLLTGITLVRELTPRSRDYIHSFGEQLSSRIVAAALRAGGIEARALLSWDLGLVTDGSFGAAHPMSDSSPRIRRSLEKVSDVPVITGYIAKDRDGNITTLGRSGSDYTASMVGAAIGAEEIEIWTDVSGVMSADPRIVPQAMSLPGVSFAEMSELAYYGARVIHPSTMVPAVESGIPVRVLNTTDPDHPGTVILDQADPGDYPVRSIAHRRGLTLINVVSTRMLLQHGFMARLFDVFARHEIVVDMISTSEVSVSITTDSKQDLTPVQKELSGISDVTLETGKAIVCLVGEGIRTAPGTVATVFSTLSEAGVATRMISVGATSINVSFLVEEADVDAAVRALHRVFFE
ncbi:MAG: aspartate kinase [Planctomycetota bacterium]|jgi:aspartate kinase